MVTIDELDDAAIREVLQTVRSVALIGASDRPARASHGVQAFLQRRGYTVTPVNPRLAGKAIHGRTVVATLTDAAPLDMVDIFRATEHVAAIVDDAIRLKARVIWMQLDVIDTQAAARARADGITVVMDRCPAIETPRLGIAALA